MDTLSLWIVGSTAVVGLTGGAHCAVMCGPIVACAGRPAGYHLARILGYSLVGLGAGAIGARGVSLAESARGPVAVAAAGLGLAVLAGAYFARRAVGRRAARLVRVFSPRVRSVVLGALTPLLPCGLSMSVVLFALATGSAAEGALVMATFALASAPSLFLVGWVRRWIGARLKPAGQTAFESALLLAAGVMVLVRVAGVVQGAACHP